MEAESNIDHPNNPSTIILSQNTRTTLVNSENTDHNMVDTTTNIAPTYSRNPIDSPQPSLRPSETTTRRNLDSGEQQHTVNPPIIESEQSQSYPQLQVTVEIPRYFPTTEVAHQNDAEDQSTQTDANEQVAASINPAIVTVNHHRLELPTTHVHVATKFDENSRQNISTIDDAGSGIKGKLVQDKFIGPSSLIDLGPRTPWGGSTIRPSNPSKLEKKKASVKKRQSTSLIATSRAHSSHCLMSEWSKPNLTQDPPPTSIELRRQTESTN